MQNIFIFAIIQHCAFCSCCCCYSYFFNCFTLIFITIKKLQRGKTQLQLIYLCTATLITLSNSMYRYLPSVTPVFPTHVSWCGIHLEMSSLGGYYFFIYEKNWIIVLCFLAFVCNLNICTSIYIIYIYYAFVATWSIAQNCVCCYHRADYN